MRYNEQNIPGDKTRMQINLADVHVIHDPAQNRFETTVNGHLSKLDYIQDEKNFVITHVGVHPELRGQGLAGVIVEASLNYAREKDLRVIPMCSYAAAYIRSHPEYLELTRQERSE
jgi:predicted GNAT family acetyltransferase